jgi:RNA polymerase-interacting CarD/CdnL/TRCF family regulator
MDNRKNIYNYMIQKGFTPNAASGIMGNIGVETGYTYDYQTKQGKGGPGYGLFQFEGNHMKNYQNFLKENEMQDSMQSQVDYMYDTIYGEGKNRDDLGYGNAKKIREVFESGSVEDAANVFLDRFEKPKNPEASRKDRIRISNEISKEFMSTQETMPMEQQPINMLDGARKFLQDELGPKFSLKHSMFYGTGLVEGLNKEENKQ